MSDYTDIQPELDDFENAVYGEEVRSSMISAIKKIHDVAESAAGAPDASSATAGQAPIADGAGGWAWGDVATSGDGVPTNVRQAILALFQNGVYTRDDMSDEVAVVQSWATEITSISVSPMTLRINGMSQETIIATTQPSGGIVTWSSSDESIATVSGGVVTPAGVNGSCTITASCGGKSATCAVTVSGFATLLSITATYTQSGTVYDTDSLDSLKSDLVVTANYDDDRSVPVTDYTLQGELTEGTSTIIVAYGGKTTTFNVTVLTGFVYTPAKGLLSAQSGITGTNLSAFTESITNDGLRIYSPIVSTESTGLFTFDDVAFTNSLYVKLVFKVVTIASVSAANTGSFGSPNLVFGNGTGRSLIGFGTTSNVANIRYYNGSTMSYIPITLNEWHTLEVSVESGKQTFTLDDTVVVNSADLNSSTSTANRLAVSNSKNTAIDFYIQRLEIKGE